MNNKIIIIFLILFCFIFLGSGVTPRQNQGITFKNFGEYFGSSPTYVDPPLTRGYVKVKKCTFILISDNEIIDECYNIPYKIDIE